MPTIPYPDVPNYPGVPNIPRTSPGNSSISISLAQNDNASQATQDESVWGIFSATDGTALYTPSESGTISTYAFDFSRQTTVSSFPVEQSAFADYDKIWSPAKPMITVAFSGSSTEKREILNIIEAACLDTSLWNIFIPETEYLGYTIARYSYRRTATKGATLLLIDVQLEEVKQVSVSYTNTSSSDLSSGATSTANAKTPSAIPASSSGQVQPKTPSKGTLQKAWTWVKRTLGIIPPSV